MSLHYDFLYIYLSGYVTVSVSGVSGSFTSSSVYQCCYWVLFFLTRLKESNNQQTHTIMPWPCVLRIVVVIFLYFSYNIHISPIFLLYNYTFSSYILLYLKQISSYIPIFFTLNVSGRSVVVHLHSGIILFAKHFMLMFDSVLKTPLS